MRPREAESLPIMLTAKIGAAVLLLALTAFVTTAKADPTDFGFASVSGSLSTAQAGAHPDLRIFFELNTDPASEEDPKGLHKIAEKPRNLSVELPPGLVGNPNALPKCTMAQFIDRTLGGDGCPIATQVGVTKLMIWGLNTPLTEPVFNMEAPSEDTVARLGYYASNLPNFINISVRSEGDYSVVGKLEGLPAPLEVVSADTHIWGVPGDSSHNNLRLTSKEAYPELKQESPIRSSGVSPAPFLSNLTRCGTPLDINLSADSYQAPGQEVGAVASLAETIGCGKVDFKPIFSLTPTSRRAAGPTGVDAKLLMPQNESPTGLATGVLRNAIVTLPEEMTIAPGAADGLEACSSQQVGLGMDVAAACPDAAKIGSVELDVPALPQSLHGTLYQRTPEPGNLFRIWLVADELGVHVKIPGEVLADRQTGRITSVFVDTPQVPVEEMKLHFKSGAKGVLANPRGCGTYATRFELTPWSSEVPQAGNAPMTIDLDCDTGGFSPGFQAGTVNASAASSHLLSST